MREQTRHAMLPVQDHDELARETFVQALKTHIAEEVTPGVRELYEHRVRPTHQLRFGVEPADRHAIKKAMETEPYYKLWSSVRRSSQELLWNSVSNSIERQIDELTARAEKLRDSSRLDLDPDFEVPWYFWGIDIHVMPGGYRGEYVADDVSRGALYDRGVYVYAQGQMDVLNDDYGTSVVKNYLKAERKEFRPKRILEMGGGLGNSLVPYVDGYPDAEVHCIDVGAGLLRYGHARAESMGKKIHFSQQNAEATKFPDGYFDLVVSHILLHEMPPSALRNVMSECHRLLSPGGIMVHADFPGYEDMDGITQFLIDWDTWNNNEPFWGPMRDFDVVKAARDAGFTGECATMSCKRDCIEQVKVPTSRVLQSGERATSGMLTLLVGVK